MKKEMKKWKCKEIEDNKCKIMRTFALVMRSFRR